MGLLLISYPGLIELVGAHISFGLFILDGGLSLLEAFGHVLEMTPLVVGLPSLLPFFFLLGSFFDERVMQQTGPPDAVVSIFGEQSLQKVSEIALDGVGILHFFLYDHFNQSVNRIGVERRLAHKQLVNEHAQGPEVRGGIIGLLIDQLGGHVERGALDRGEHLGVVGHGSSESEIAQFDDSVGANEDILGLHVSVDDSVGMKVIEGVNELLSDFAHLLQT